MKDLSPRLALVRHQLSDSVTVEILLHIVCALGYQPTSPQKHHYSLFRQALPLNLQTVQSHTFLAIPHYILVFCEPPLPAPRPLKLAFFSELPNKSD